MRQRMMIAIAPACHPKVLKPILVSATLGPATVFITESTRLFLGLGFPGIGKEPVRQYCLKDNVP